MHRLIKRTDTSSIQAKGVDLTSKPLSFIGSPHGSQHIRAEMEAFSLKRLLPYIDDIGDLATKDIDIISQSLIEYAEAHHPLLMFMPLGSISQLPSDFWSSFHRPVHVSSRVLTDHPEVAHLGIQRHYQDESWAYDSHKHLRISTMRQDPEHAEVILRTADCVVMKLDVLRLSDNLGSTTSGSAGLTIEEMWLAYYALDGYEIRTRELSQKEQLQRYSVMPEHISQELVFVEDQRSNRWWIELYSGAAEEVVNMPCTRRDYEDACQNIISDRLTTLMTST